MAAGVFLWSRRNQISDQIGNLSDQISEWREGMASDSDFEPTKTGRQLHRPARAAEPRRPQEPGGNLRRGADAQGNRQGDRLEPVAIAQSRGALRAPFLCGEEIGDRFAELRLGDRAHVGSGHFREDRIGKAVGELLGRAIVVVLGRRTRPASAW